jgi:hypothetical protein
VCASCQKKCLKYQKISHTAAQRKYFLTNDHLKQVENISKTLTFYGRQKNTIWYLEKDILRLVRSVYTVEQFNTLRRQRVSKYIKHILEKHFKFSMLRRYMMEVYDIDIIPYIRYINIYAGNLYKRYLSNKANSKLFRETTLKFIELQYIFLTENRIPYNLTTYYFQPYFLNNMIMERDNHMHNIDYFNRKRHEIMCFYTEFFDRRNEIKHVLKDISGWSLEDYNIKNYIYNNKGDVYEIRLDYMELAFFRQNTNIDHYDKYLFKIAVKKMLEQEKFIPKWIIDRNS